MTEVFFNGRGEWYFKDKNRKKLVIDRGYNEGQSTRVENIYCPEFTGIFTLTDDDEKHYQTIKDFSVIQQSVKELLPSSHPDSPFSKMVERGTLLAENYDKYRFVIQKERRNKKQYTPVHCQLKLINQKNIEAQNTTFTNHSNKSDKLVFLNQASAKFWSSADPKQKDTWPDTNKIVSWFIEKEFSPTLAERAASIIRPEWAVSGRR